MDALKDGDVPYGNDWDSAVEAAAYGDSADKARPWRPEIREHIAARVAQRAPHGRVLELGSGPGLLANEVLQRCPEIAEYTLLDFSAPMLALSKARLAGFPAATYLLQSFKSEHWLRAVQADYDCILTMQAVHELRHKHHALKLYAQVYEALASAGLFLVCDHTPFDHSAKNTALYMTEREQQDALASAGFSNVHVELSVNGLVLYAAESAG